MSEIFVNLNEVVAKFRNLVSQMLYLGINEFLNMLFTYVVTLSPYEFKIWFK